MMYGGGGRAGGARGGTHGSTNRAGEDSNNELLSALLGSTENGTTSTEAERTFAIVKSVVEESYSLLRRLRVVLISLVVADVLGSFTLFVGEDNGVNHNSLDINKYYLDRSVIDLLFTVVIRGVFITMVAVLSHRVYTRLVNWVYWITMMTLVFAIGKSIAFDWNEESAAMISLLLLSIAAGIVEVALLDRVYVHIVLLKEAVRFTEEGPDTAGPKITEEVLKRMREIEEQERGFEEGDSRAVNYDSETGVVSSNGVANAPQSRDYANVGTTASATNAANAVGTSSSSSSSSSSSTEINAETGKLELTRASLLGVLKPYFWPKSHLGKLRCALTWVCLGLSKIMNLLAPLYIGTAVQKLSDGETAQVVFTDIIIYSFLSLGSKIMREVQNVIYLRVKQHAYAEIAEHTFRHLHSLSLEWHLKKRMGNVLRSMDRGVSAADTVTSYLFLYLLPSIVESIVVFVIFFVHFNVPTLSTVAFISFVLYTVSTVQLTLWRAKFRERTNKHDNDYHDRATDSLVNFETVKYFSAENFEVEQYVNSIKQFQKYTVSTQASLSLLNSTQQTIIQACMAISLCVAAFHVTRGDLDSGDFVSVQVYISQLFAPLSFLGTIYGAVIQAFVDMTNLSQLLAESPDVTDPPSAKQLKVSPEKASVEFRNVYFHYPAQLSSSGLQNISFRVEPGTETALVGHTGSGKTSIGRLLFRFYDPLSGQVLIADQDISTVTQKSLREHIGVVPQDCVLFNTTLMDNILYGRRDATQREVEEACRSAQLLDFIQALPQGFNTQVGERGLRLSGGEKQRVAIARCLLKGPQIVLLDEATSSLDTNTEKAVQGALQGLTSSRTTLTIAHRLSTISGADQILVLDRGKIVERGTHSTLISADGMYAKLWRIQAENSQETDV